MKGKRNPFVAREGMPWIILVVAIFGLLLEFADPVYLIIPLVLIIWLIAIFRDPRRHIPAIPLGLVSPVDGTVLEVGLTDKSVLGGAVGLNAGQARPQPGAGCDIHDAALAGPIFWRLLQESF